MIKGRSLLGAFTLTALLLGCSHREERSLVAVHGDSTAIASRIPLTEKLWNVAPSWDRQRWFNQLGRSVFNDGKAGAPVARVRQRIASDPAHRGTTTIIYDLVNVEETAPGYMGELSKAVSLLETKRFVIVPQVPDAYAVDHGENMASRAMRPRIDREVLAKWPNNTFAPAERAAFYAELSDPATRYDGLHRNARGQQIEAKYIKRWLDARGW